MELLDIVDEYGNPTGETVERGKAHLEGIRHRTSHVWLLREKNGKVQILLQKRCETKDSFPGCYDISSAGHIPAGVGFAESAIRELKEELGISVQEADLVLCGDKVYGEDNCFHGIPYHDRQYSRIFCLWNDTDEEDFVIQKEELDSVSWFDLDECMEAVRNNTIKHCIYIDELQMVEGLVRSF